MKLFRSLALAAALIASPAAADSGLRFTPLGYCQLTTLASSVSIQTCANWSSVSGATRVVITPETQAVRYRDDKSAGAPVAPTATVGMPLAVGQTFEYSGTISALLFIEQTASAKVNLVFYK